jgi:hypothetical protein
MHVIQILFINCHVLEYKHIVLKLLDLFTGMFPYVCLATMPIFCDANWPRKILEIFSASESTVKNKDEDNKCATCLLPPGINRAGEFGIKMSINFTLNLDCTLMTTVLDTVFNYGDDYFVFHKCFCWNFIYRTEG